MFCPECGKDIPDNSKFCFGCGANFRETVGDFETVLAEDTRPPEDFTLGEEATLLETSQSIQNTFRYKILATLGQGGMGTVYKAKDNKLGRFVALKRLLPAFSDNRQAFSRFISEAKSLASLSHPNIVQVYDIDEDNEGHFIIMEYVESGSLKDLIKEKGQLEEDEARRIIIDVCKGVAQAHEKNIIHRDIKPANILIHDAGSMMQVKLADFGIAQMADGDEMTRTGIAMGTPVYMAPEQQVDAKHVDQRADVYSIGATFYEMLTGESPRVIDMDNVSVKYRDLLKKALSDRPEGRFAKIDRFVEEIAKTKDKGALTEDNANEVRVVHQKSLENKFELKKTSLLAKLEEELTSAAVEHESKASFLRKEISNLIKERDALRKDLESRKPEYDKLEADYSRMKRNKENLEKRIEDKKNSKPLFLGRSKHAGELQIFELELGTINEYLASLRRNIEGSPIFVLDKVEGSILAKQKELSDEESGYAKLKKAMVERLDKNRSAKMGDPLQIVDEPEMVRIEGGEFEMGNIFGDVEGDYETIHTVRLDDFYIGKYPVTFDEYDVYCEDTGTKKPNDNGWGRGRRPVINVCWEDAQGYLKWLSEQTGKEYRLPTEAEWEYAARSGGKKEKYAGTSNKSSLSEYAWHCENSGRKTHPVGVKKPNGLGLYDMIGNVSVWCSDWYEFDYYGRSPKNNPKGPASGNARVSRGSSYGTWPMRFIRVSDRSRNNPGKRYDSLGFRCARTP